MAWAARGLALPEVGCVRTLPEALRRAAPSDWVISGGLHSLSGLGGPRVQRGCHPTPEPLPGQQPLT